MGCKVCSKFNGIIKLQSDPPITTVSQIHIRSSNFIKQNNKQFRLVYRVGKLIRTDQFGQTRKCKHRTDGAWRAVRLVKTNILQTRQSKQALQRQINILRKLDHPTIIRIYEFFQQKRQLFIVMELCQGGELFEQILKRDYFSQNHAAQIMYQLLSSVAYLHSRLIVHRDIKPENINLYQMYGKLNIKLIQLDKAIQVQSLDTIIQQVVGNSYFMAPQMINQHYTHLCDLWSCGTIMYVLLTGRPPFMGNTQYEIIEAVKTGVFDTQSALWNRISDSAKDLIKKLLVPETERITAQQALQHPWICSLARQSQLDKDIYQYVFANLKQFNACSKLRDAVHTYITTQCLSIKEIGILKEVFLSIDKNGDGMLSREELIQEYSKSLGPEEAEVEVDLIMKEVDTDNSGFIDYTQFIKASVNVKNVLSAQNLRQAFNVFDSENKGRISAQQLKRALIGGNSSDDTVWEQIIKEVDENGDGYIDMNEFFSIISSKC